MWIVPGDVQVRADGDSLYVIKADLSVQAKPERIAGMPCTPDPQANAAQVRLEQRLVVPKIIEAVNKDPVDSGLLSRTVNSLRTFATGRNGVLAIVIVMTSRAAPGRFARPQAPLPCPATAGLSGGRCRTRRASG